MLVGPNDDEALEVKMAIHPLIVVPNCLHSVAEFIHCYSFSKRRNNTAEFKNL